MGTPVVATVTATATRLVSLFTRAGLLDEQSEDDVSDPLQILRGWRRRGNGPATGNRKHCADTLLRRFKTYRSQRNESIALGPKDRVDRLDRTSGSIG